MTAIIGGRSKIPALSEKNSDITPQHPNAEETPFLKSPESRAILGALDILVDIGVPAEKEVIQ